MKPQRLSRHIPGFKKQGWVLLFGLLFIARISSGATQPGEKQQDRLHTLQKQLKEKQSTYQKMTTQESGLYIELKTLERQLNTYQQQLQQQQTQLQEHQKVLKEVQQSLAQRQKNYHAKKDLLGKRLRAIYKMGNLGYLMPLLAMSSHTETQQHIRYLQQISENDRQLIKSAEKDIRAITRQKEAIEHQRQEVLQGKKAIEQQRAHIASQRKQKEQLLHKIRQDKQQYAVAIQTLEDSAKNLEQLLQKLPEKPVVPQASKKEPVQSIVFPQNPEKIVQAYGRHFRANKGKLLWPVQGKILTNYGKVEIPETNTYTFYKGVDIQAKSGTPFYAVFKGMVKYAGWFEGYGNLIILDHGGNFYTLYAHADKIAVKSGELIEARQFLGNVGDTDSLKGTHLYFEIRANGKPVNPKLWLAKVR